MGSTPIGARRQVFRKTLLKKENRTDTLWLDEVPERVMPNDKRNAGSVYHFLLPDKGMVDYKDKVVKQLVGEDIKKINNWRTGFTREFSKSEIKTLQKLSDTIDKLWSKHTEQQCDMRKRTTDVFAVWGQTRSAEARDNTGIRWKDKVFEQELLSKKIRNSSPYRRLKLAMDYWCSLWSWPIDKADLLPSRDEYLLDLSLILEGNPVDITHGGGEQRLLFPDTMPTQMQLKLVNEFGIVDVDKLCGEIDRLTLVKELADKYRFLHWELEFADIFEDNGGFDLVLGNPPWVKLAWNEGNVLGDAEPLFVLRKYNASKLASYRDYTLSRYGFYSKYFSLYEESELFQNYLNAVQNYSILKGVQTNLYKCFLPQSWMICCETNGITSLLHPEGIYDDSKGGKVRKAVYQKLKKHYQFQNEFKLFPIGNRKRFSINIYLNSNQNVEFDSIANLYHPSTIDACYDHTGLNSVPGIKNSYGSWDVKGHSKRVLKVREFELKSFSAIFDSMVSDHLEARLPAIHSQQFINVLNKFSAQTRKLGDLGNEYCATEMWHETNAEKKDGTIYRNTSFPKKLEEWILSGPHFYLANPFYQTPRKNCNTHRAYDNIDLTFLPKNYLPRSNYFPAIDAKEYSFRVPTIPWDEDKRTTNYYRLISKFQLDPSNERTLISTIIPRYVGHINTGVSLIFKDISFLAFISGFFFSIIFDFWAKISGMATFPSLSKTLPIPSRKNVYEIILRVMVLVSLTEYYNEFWSSLFSDCFTSDKWTKSDHRLSNSFFKDIHSEWSQDCALRTDFSRRQALVEIDVLAAIAFGLALDELKTIYRVQFPVLYQNECDTWYDQKGRIVFTCSKGLHGVGFSRSEWNEIKDMKEGMVERKIINDTLPGGSQERTIVYHAPFDRCDREKDYEVAWKEFERRFKDKEDNS